MLKQLLDLLLFRRSPPPVNYDEAPPLRAVDAPAPGVTKKAAIPAVVAAMIAGTIALEGGYVNHPNDRGGETNMGITKRVARQNGYSGPMRTLPRDVAVSIYYEDYIVAPGFEPLVEINAPVVEELYDTGTNMGPAWPSKFLQQSLNDVCGSRITVDARVGPNTVAAFVACQNQLGAAHMCVTMLSRLDYKQQQRYYAIVNANPSQKVFLRGWLNHRIGNVDRRKCRVGAR